MLLNLHVKNMALLKEVDVDFSNGLIVLSGETGAGKSLILGSVNVALGNKASRELIRTGADYSLVEMTFLVDDSVAEKLRDMDIYMENENTVTVTRKITEGRSVAKINGETVNLNGLKQAMNLLLDIHGQHDHQSLLYANQHLKILDKFAKEDIHDIISRLGTEYATYANLKKKLEHYDLDEGKKAREIEFAKFEIEEISSADLKVGEDDILEEELKKLSNGEQIIKNLSEIYRLLSYENENSAGELISRAVTDMNQMHGYDTKIEEFQNTLYDIDSLCRDLTGEIYDYTQTLEFQPERIRQVEERLDIINHLKLKYGGSIEKILHYQEEKQKYLDRLLHYNEEMEQVEKAMKESKIQLNNLCIQLSERRKAAAKKLEQLIKEALADLNFIAVEFQIRITKRENITENGFDIVEFMISTNPGEPLKPLAKVASGGELSRIMLAIKSILANEDEIETLIFDEIDSGISGKTALMVAEKLAKISKKHQVICISHLAQIVAMADEHFLIEKKLQNNTTITDICKLDREASIREMVRISSGGEITEAAITHARQMKDMADRTKCNLV